MTAASETEKREHDISSQELAFDIRKIENCLEVGKVGILKANRRTFVIQILASSWQRTVVRFFDTFRTGHWVDPLILR